MKIVFTDECPISVGKLIGSVVCVRDKQVGRWFGDHFLEEMVIGIRDISFWKKEKFGDRN